MNAESTPLVYRRPRNEPDRVAAALAVIHSNGNTGENDRERQVTR